MPAKANQQEQTHLQEWGPSIIAVGVTLAALLGVHHGISTVDNTDINRALYECRADARILQERLNFRPVSTQRMQSEYETALSVCAESRAWVKEEARACLPRLIP